MPYTTISSLPKEIKDALPVGAQNIFKSAFNSALNNGNTEQSAFKIAWNKVKAKYRKAGETWVKKALSTPAFLQGVTLTRENLKKPKKPKNNI